MKFLKQAIYVRYVIAKLPKFFEISLQTSLDSFLQRILQKLTSKFEWMLDDITTEKIISAPIWATKAFFFF